MSHFPSSFPVFPEKTLLHPQVLLSPAETKIMDQTVPSDLESLMINAGTMAGRVIRKKIAPCKVLVACGPGNNGGDGFVLARFLQNHGWPVAVTLLKNPPGSALALKMYHQWKGPVVPFIPEQAGRFDLVVDALFGAGMNRNLQPEVELFLAAAKKIIAIDLPSGIDGLNGRLMGKVSPCAMSICFVRPRPGHFLSPGASYCGEIICVDIGLSPEAMTSVDPVIFHNAPGLWPLPVQKAGDHKYKRGVVSLVGGHDMPGAARLSAGSARRTGAGMVRIVTNPEDAPFYRLGDAGLIIDDNLETALKDPRRKVWICGPGLLPEEAARILPLLIAGGKDVIADAGALSWAAEDLSRLKNVKIITPHEGEFSHLFPHYQGSRLQAAQRAAQAHDVIVVLKGEDTVIAAPDGHVVINTHATPALATAGTGDVLTGVIGALYAAGMSAWEAACAGVWLHGHAGLMAAEQHGGWILAEDVVSFLGLARNEAEEEQKKLKN